jgi:nitroreductase
MNFEEVVKYRRSVRQYNDTPLDSEKVKHCLELASLAPTVPICNFGRFITLLIQQR